MKLCDYFARWSCLEDNATCAGTQYFQWERGIYLEHKHNGLRISVSDVRFLNLPLLVALESRHRSTDVDKHSESPPTTHQLSDVYISECIFVSGTTHYWK